MTFPRTFNLHDRFTAQYDEADEHRRYELQVMHVYDDGAIDVAEVTAVHSPDIKDAWTIFPAEWPRYWALIEFDEIRADLLALGLVPIERGDEEA
jgi:hypothetical protein